MTKQLFPTFEKWLQPLSDIRLGVWRLRGPTWYISTWFGDSLATQQRSLLRILSIAHQERLELAPLIRCLAEEHRGRYRWLLNRLARRLDSGAALVDALEQSPDALDDDAVLALRFGNQSGTTQAAFAMLLSREDPTNVSPIRVTHMWAYWSVLAFTIVFMLSIMMVIIAPTFKKMFEEFGLNLPAPLQTLIFIYGFFVNYAPLWILLALVAIGLFWSSAVRRFFRRSVAPMFMRPVAQMRKAELLRLLSVGVESGRPLAGSLSTLARYHFDSRVRQRLLFARNEIEQGVESWQGLKEAEFLTQHQAAAVGTAPTNEIRAWILRRLASSMQVESRQRTSIGLALMQPVAVLAFGGIVLFVFVSFFSVLIALITSLA